MKLHKPERLGNGDYRVSVRVSGRDSQCESERLQLAFAAALEAMPDGEQAERFTVEFERDRGSTTRDRSKSARIDCALYTVERGD